MKRIGIVVALAAEGRTLTATRAPRHACVDLQDGNLLVVADAGPAAASLAAAHLLDKGVEALVSWGCAAALDPHLKPGDLVLPGAVREAGGGILPVETAWRERIRARLDGSVSVYDGTLAESAEIVSTPQDKARLFAATGAVALDMESAAVARAAAASHVPLLVVRSIVDPANVGIPPSIQSAFAADGSLHIQKLLAGLIRRPHDLPGMIRLGRHFRAAMETLRTVNALAGNGLGKLV